MKKVLEFINIIFIILLFILIINSSFRITYNMNYNLNDYSKYFSIFGIIELILYIVSKIKNFKFNKLEIIVIILMILSCLSIFTSINIEDCLFGKINRREGLFVILTYYLLILNCMNIRNKKYIIVIIILISLFSLINIIYGLFQVGIINSNLDIKNKWYYARGLLGNSMYFGTLMSIFYGLILGLFIKVNNINKKIILFVLLLIASLGIIMSGAMSSIISVIIIYLVILIESIVLVIKRNNYGKYLLKILIISIILFISIFKLYSINNNNLKNDLLEVKNQTNSISKGNVSDNFGTGRVYIWKNTINKIIEHKGIGVGVDNFRNAFDSKLLDPISGYIVDKAHNDYLQKMLCEGVIAGLLFIIFLLFIFFKLLLKNINSIYYGLFLSFTMYSVQAFFNISVTRVAPIYFIIIGLLVGCIYERSN